MTTAPASTTCSSVRARSAADAAVGAPLRRRPGCAWCCDRSAVTARDRGGRSSCGPARRSASPGLAAGPGRRRARRCSPVRRVTGALSPAAAAAGPAAGAPAPATSRAAWNWAARDALRAAVNRWETPLDWCASRPRAVHRAASCPGSASWSTSGCASGTASPASPIRPAPAPCSASSCGRSCTPPPRRPPSPRDLAAIVAELEKTVMNDVDRSMPPAEVGPAGPGGPGRGRHGRGRQAGRPGAGPRRHPGRRARAAGGPAGPGQDADRALASRRRSGWSSAACSSPRTCCPPTSPARSSTTSAPHDFTFRAGPVFTNLLLADEINRTPPKTQSALLEAMQEKQVSVEGVTYRLDAAVPRAGHRQPDRVRGHLPAARGAARPVPAPGLVRLPGRTRRSGRCCAAGWPAAGRRPRSSRWSTRPPCWRCRPRWRTWWSRTRSAGTSWRSTAATREHPSVLVGASPRGSLALLLLARARAALGRPGLRRAGGRQGGGGARAGAPDHAAPGDVAAPGRPVVRGRRGAGATPGPGQRRAAQLRGRRGPGADGRPPCPHREPPSRSRPPAGRRPGRSAGRCCSPALLLVAAVLLGRVDLVVLAAPFALGTAYALRRRPDRAAAGLRSPPTRRTWSRAATSPRRSPSATRTRSATTWRWCGPGSRRGCGSSGSASPAAARRGRGPSPAAPTGRS